MERNDYEYGKRTQRDYSMPLKLSVVKEVECGFISKRVIIPIRKNSSPRTIQKFGKERKKSISNLCRLFGMSRQKYYRSFWRKSKKQEQSIQVIDNVNSIRSLMPHIGTRKLHHLLEDELKPLGGAR